ncbi:MAG: phosphate acyltransferase [Bacteroidales bacterium]|nr:phosphate acyltransferase [Bacteroidales bacterium]
MIKIGVDILGGDYAPDSTVKGAIIAAGELPDDTKLVLIGDREKIVEICSSQGFDPSVFEVIHTTDTIEMSDYPAKAFTQKPNASIVLGFKMLSQGMLHGFASAGNTGAMLVGAMHLVKSAPGVIRPCITASIPKLSDNPTILLDVGINPDTKPDVMYQYAILGSLYAEYVYNINNPKVALLNIGSEEEKGNLQSKAAFSAMKGTVDFNFIGNIEANELFSDKADVIVCDGFVGNVMLKEAEAFYSLIRKRKIQDEFFEKFNFVNYGGTPILGINAPVIIGHGISNEIAIKNMILHTASVINAKLIDKIKEAFK